jgi:hypothetical protein
MVAFEDSVTVHMRHYLSGDLIRAAALFSRELHRMESERGPTDADITRHRAFAIGAVTCSVAFLEAYINEFFSDTDELPTSIGGLPSSTVGLLAKMWNRHVPRLPALDKYQVALELAGKDALMNGQAPFQDAQLLVKLRNALIHYEPETVLVAPRGTAQRDLEELERQLRDKFTLNPWTGIGNPFFPDRCLGHGSSEWAVNSSLAFVEEFCTRMERNPSWAQNRNDVATR